MDYGEIILELLDRIKKLEKDVEELKKANLSCTIPSPDVSFEDLPDYFSGTGANCSASDSNNTDNSYPKQRENLFFTKILEEQNGNPNGSRRDMTRYMFNGNVYLKNRLVLAVVTYYVNNTPGLTRQLLSICFNKSLQGSIGVVENVEIARRRTDYSVRFFTREEEVLHLADGDMYVCTQWGISNINNFISRAKQLGYIIEPIKPL